ncbi:hypothetical protein Z946_3532 [Sulfitobacter noctilucicola]|nr:hypothetical protein Z946_3532 [Sulfitobacter noctilucicola]
MFHTPPERMGAMTPTFVQIATLLMSRLQKAPEKAAAV